MPRPRRSPASLRTVAFKVRFTPDEAEALQARSAETGLVPAAYLRRAALGQPLPRAVPPVNRTLHAELARVGGNLNQLAHAANSGQPVVVDSALLRELAGLLNLTRKRLVDDP